MYHVSANVRAQRSAKAICTGLAQCLEEKPFEKITVKDVYDKCLVSRATFYRLFDGLTDVLQYECDSIFRERLGLLVGRNIVDKKEQAIQCMKIWMRPHSIIKPLLENRMEWIIYETHQKNAELLRSLTGSPFRDEWKSDYFISVFSSVICTALSVYFKHGGEEPIEEVYEVLAQSLRIIDKSFNG